VQEPDIGVKASRGKLKPIMSQKRRAKEQPKKMWLAVSRGAWQMGHPAFAAVRIFLRSNAALD
jgi:hypothetical protein